jgi:hypothetical protein
MVQHGVDIVKNLPLAHPLATARPKLPQRPIRDILPPIATVLGVGVVGEALKSVGRS